MRSGAMKTNERRPIPQTRSSFWTSHLGMGGGSDIPAFGLSIGGTQPQSSRSPGGSAGTSTPEDGAEALSSCDEEASDDLEMAVGSDAAVGKPAGYVKLERQRSANVLRSGDGAGSPGYPVRGAIALGLGKLAGSCSSLAGPFTGAVPIVVLNFATCATYGLLMVEGTTIDPQLLVAMQLYSAGVSGVFLALKSGCRVTIASGDASVALYTNLWLRQAFHHPDCTDETREPTAIASVLVMTILMGFVYLLVGHYRAADLVQYLPFPIIAGFLGMVGASIVRGGLVVALGQNLASIADLGSAAISVPYEFGAALGLVFVLLVLRRVRVPTNVLFMSTMAAALLLFYAPTTFLRIARSELRVRGFLFPISEPVGPLDIWWRLDTSRVTWSALVPASGEVFGTLTILTISLVLRVSAIDSAAQVGGRVGGRRAGSETDGRPARRCRRWGHGGRACEGAGAGGARGGGASVRGSFGVGGVCRPERKRQGRCKKGRYGP